MSIAPEKHWPPRLRKVLRDRLSTLGQGDIPRGLVIRYHPPFALGGGREEVPASIEIRHNPDATEQGSVHDRVASFDGSDEDVVRFLDLAVPHALSMKRRDARRTALVSAGHDPRRPPLHALEADPLTALLLALVRAGRAGLHGDVGVRNGRLDINNMRVTADGRSIHIVNPGTMRVKISGQWSEGVAIAMAGRRLGDVLALPGCGDAQLDRAAADIRVLAGQVLASEGGALCLVLERARVVELAPTPAGEDGGWKAMEPRPIA